MGVYDGENSKLTMDNAFNGSRGSLKTRVTEMESIQKLRKRKGASSSMIIPATLFIEPGVPPVIFSEGFQLELTGHVKSISTFSIDQPPSFLNELPNHVSL